MRRTASMQAGGWLVHPRCRALLLALALCCLLRPLPGHCAQPAPGRQDKPPVLAAGEIPLVAVVPANMPPLYTTNADGTPTGFATELLRQLAERSGYRLRFIVKQGMAEAMRALLSGEAQVLPGLGVSPERAAQFDFSHTIDTMPVHVFYRRQGPGLETMADLAGKRVSLVRGSVPQEILEGSDKIRRHLTNNLAQALFDLYSGETDALVYQRPLVEHVARGAELEQLLGRSVKPLFEVQRALAVRKGDQALQARLGAALDEYRHTEGFQELYTAWHADEPPPMFTPKSLRITLGLLLALAAGLLGWRAVSLLRMNRTLRAALRERDQALAGLSLSHRRMQGLVELTQMTGEDAEGLVRFALEGGVRLTGSEVGFLAFLQGDEVNIDSIHWSEGARKPRPRPDRTVYAISEAGLWADSVRTREPLVVNDYANHPDRSGLPEGHMPVARFMAVPLVEEDRVVAVFGVANKTDPYDENDTRQLQLFLSGLWRVRRAKQDAEDLRAVKGYAESLIEGANALIMGLDGEGRVTLFNAAAEALTGYSRAEVLGRDWSSVMLPESESSASSAQYREFMAGRAALPRQQVGKLVTKAGAIRHISWQNSLLKQDGEVAGLIAFGIDITGRKQAEDERMRLHRAIEQAGEGVLIADETGTILYANPAFERLAGTTLSGPQLVGRSVFDLDVSVLEHQSSTLHGGAIEGTWRGACSFARPGGGAAEMEFTVSAVRGRSDRLTSYVAVCRDVTEKRQLEHQLWQAQKMEALGTLAGGVAHDFNNLLASIMGFSELAMDDVGQDSRARACLERVLSASLRARELVRQILSFSRRGERKLAHLNAETVVAEALKLLEASLPKNIVVGAELAAPGSTVLVDPSQLHQIVMNLCTNAAQAMEATGGRLLVRSRAEMLSSELASRHRLQPGEYLRLTVEDDGPGIPPDVLGRIFDPFFTTKAPGEGTGLGLAVVHGIVASLGGAVWAESELAAGACFCVLLPVRNGAEEPGREARILPKRGRENVLIVDDEPDLLELGREALSPRGYNVTATASPEAALAALKADPAAFDLVITDQNMPGMTGLELAEAIRALRGDLPILLITGLSRTIPPDRLDPLGAAWLLPKPFSMMELTLAVQNALARQKEGNNDQVRTSG